MPVWCGRCGQPNPDWGAFCGNCGAALTAVGSSGPPPTPYPQPPYPMPQYPPQQYPPPQAAYGMPYPAPAPGAPYGYPYGYISPERQVREKGVSRTKSGLYLLTLAFLLSWIPVVGLFSVLLVAFGGALLLLGRRPFGTRHARLLLVALALFLAALAASAVVTLSLFAGAYPQGPSVDLAALRDDARTYLWGGVLVVGLYGAASVLAIFEILPPRGRLLATVAAALAVAGAALAAAEASSLVDLHFIGVCRGYEDCFGRLDAFLSAVPVIYGIPSSLAFAATYFLPTILIGKGELPKEAEPPAFPSGPTFPAPEAPTAYAVPDAAGPPYYPPP